MLRSGRTLQRWESVTWRVLVCVADPKLEQIYIKDVKSSNGTFINGERLSPEGVESDPYELKSDDIVVRCKQQKYSPFPLPFLMKFPSRNSVSTS